VCIFLAIGPHKLATTVCTNHDLIRSKAFCGVSLTLSPTPYDVFIIMLRDLSKHFFRANIVMLCECYEWIDMELLILLIGKKFNILIVFTIIILVPSTTAFDWIKMMHFLL